MKQTCGVNPTKKPLSNYFRFIFHLPNEAQTFIDRHAHIHTHTYASAAFTRWKISGWLQFTRPIKVFFCYVHKQEG